jgi:hypothetical protein
MQVGCKERTDARCRNNSIRSNCPITCGVCSCLMLQWPWSTFCSKLTRMFACSDTIKLCSVLCMLCRVRKIKRLLVQDNLMGYLDRMVPEVTIQSSILWFILLRNSCPSNFYLFENRCNPSIALSSSITFLSPVLNFSPLSLPSLQNFDLGLRSRSDVESFTSSVFSPCVSRYMNLS